MSQRRLNVLLGERPCRAELAVATSDLPGAARQLFDAGFRLALVSATREYRVAYLFTAGPPDQRIELHVQLDPAAPRLVSLANLSFPAGRFEREMRDLFGIELVDHPQPRPLVLHQHWPADWHPMVATTPVPAMDTDAVPYPFAKVEGSGVYEIPVGPVHAGLIEPGHFRFWVVGETIVRMKARLWFVHKGIERLFEGRDSAAAIELAERISGDSAVAHSLALCLALEEARGVVIDERASTLRATLLELERLYNHVADIGALCNDTGFGLGNAHALTIRERLLRLNEAVTGHRLLRGALHVGGAALRSLPRAAELKEIRTDVRALLSLARANSILMDRLTGTGVLRADQVREMGVLGVAARAAGVDLDARRLHPFVALDDGFTPSTRVEGDVLARFNVRCDEIESSLDLLLGYVAAPGPLAIEGSSGRDEAGHGSGIVEGWRGAVVHRVECDAEGLITRNKVVDPSFMNWPALPIALVDTIVPDFPLVNKSFNLSYAGNDL